MDAVASARALCGEPLQRTVCRGGWSGAPDRHAQVEGLLKAIVLTTISHTHTQIAILKTNVEQAQHRSKLVDPVAENAECAPVVTLKRPSAGEDGDDDGMEVF